MSFGIIGRTGPGMRQGFGDRSRTRGPFGVNLGRAIVTNRNFTAYICDSAATRPSSQITLANLLPLCNLDLPICLQLNNITIIFMSGYLNVHVYSSQKTYT